MTRIPINDDNNVGEQSDADEAAAQMPDLDVERADPADAGANDGGRLRAERDDLYNRLARATADFKNTQKRLQTEADQRVQYANQSLIKSLLPVIDNFERALAVDPAKTDVASLLKGMQIVHDQWLVVLRQQNVEEIAPEPGTPFDPTRHEALMQQPSEQRGPGGEPVVTQLLQKGYGLQGRTLRPAQVAVSKTG